METPAFRRAATVLLSFWLLVFSDGPAPGARAAESRPEIALDTLFARQVDMRLEVPGEERLAYGERLARALAAAGVRVIDPQYFLLVDRSPVVQAAFIYFYSPSGEWRFVGASPASTGQPGGFEHFLTPLGVFAHTLANPDFRAEGTLNKNGIRGYGVRGMRVYDFGWVQAQRTWGARGPGQMRLQVHATDPDRLERDLGRPRSKGCIRIPATFNVFLDRYGLLDADYEKQATAGRHLWVLRSDRMQVAWPGEYLVIVDSARRDRPAWSPWPPRRERLSAIEEPARADNPLLSAGGSHPPVMEGC